MAGPAQTLSAPDQSRRSLLADGMAVVWLIALAKLAFHVYFNNRYGYFRDEFNYMSCGDHLQWGYVHQPPLIPFLIHVCRALLGDSLRAIRFIPALASSRIPGNIVVNLAIANIDKNPFQTRYVHNDDALAELRESIKANGVLQPIVVRPAEEDGRYILIVGERRLHASRQAGRETIPALVRRVSEQQAAEMTIIENLQREDLSPLEQAEAFRVLSEEFKLTQAQIGERVGLSRASVANYMRLLRLPREVMQLLAEKKINFAEAKELLRLEDNDQIAKAALFAVKKGMNIEQIERLVMRMEGLLDPIPGMPGTESEEEWGAVGGSECAFGAGGAGAVAGGAGEDSRSQGQREDRD